MIGSSASAHWQAELRLSKLQAERVKDRERILSLRAVDGFLQLPAVGGDLGEARTHQTD